MAETSHVVTIIIAIVAVLGSVAFAFFRRAQEARAHRASTKAVAAGTTTQKTVDRVTGRVKAAAETAVTTVDKSLGEATKTVSDAVASLVKRLDDLASLLETEVSAVPAAAVSGVSRISSEVSSSIDAAFKTSIAGVSASFVAWSRTIQAAADAVVQPFEESAKAVGDAGKTVAASLKAAAADVARAEAAVATGASDTGAALTAFSKSVSAAVEDAVRQLDALKYATSKAVSAFDGVSGDVQAAFAKAAKSLASIGDAAASSLTNLGASVSRVASASLAKLSGVPGSVETKIRASTTAASSAVSAEAAKMTASIDAVAEEVPELVERGIDVISDAADEAAEKVKKLFGAAFKAAKAAAEAVANAAKAGFKLAEDGVGNVIVSAKAMSKHLDEDLSKAFGDVGKALGNIGGAIGRAIGGSTADAPPPPPLPWHYVSDLQLAWAVSPKSDLHFLHSVVTRNKLLKTCYAANKGDFVGTMKAAAFYALGKHWWPYFTLPELRAMASGAAPGAAAQTQAQAIAACFRSAGVSLSAGAASDDGPWTGPGLPRPSDDLQNVISCLMKRDFPVYTKAQWYPQAAGVYARAHPAIFANMKAYSSGSKTPRLVTAGMTVGSEDAVGFDNMTAYALTGFALYYGHRGQFGGWPEPNGTPPAAAAAAAVASMNPYNGNAPPRIVWTWTPLARDEVPAKWKETALGDPACPLPPVRMQQAPLFLAGTLQAKIPGASATGGPLYLGVYGDALVLTRTRFVCVFAGGSGRGGLALGFPAQNGQPRVWVGTYVGVPRAWTSSINPPNRYKYYYDWPLLAPQGPDFQFTTPFYWSLTANGFKPGQV